MRKSPWLDRGRGSFLFYLAGGAGRNRTGVHGFAVRCVTTPPPRLTNEWAGRYKPACSAGQALNRNRPATGYNPLPARDCTRPSGTITPDEILDSFVDGPPLGGSRRDGKEPMSASPNFEAARAAMVNSPVVAQQASGRSPDRGTWPGPEGTIRAACAAGRRLCRRRYCHRRWPLSYGTHGAVAFAAVRCDRC